MGWLARRRQARHQAQIDAINEIFGFNRPEVIAQYERDVEEDRQAAATRRAYSALIGRRFDGQPLPNPTPEQRAERRKRGLIDPNNPDPEYHEPVDDPTTTLSAEAYRHHITGQTHHRATNPTTAQSYDFHGTDGQYLIWTIADLHTAFPSTPTTLERAITDTATAQRAASAEQPIIWYVQQWQDATHLRRLLPPIIRIEYHPATKPAVALTDPTYTPPPPFPRIMGANPFD
ncbi:hypothetical protein EK0264_11605 [Epidermidibacterium keratini]|uniref:Uncharacterized protein n=1 Tax=Epidermidibacterium keratini TaxID=1891644 RepID=A0A7L4YNM1_9ACTN|nr:hypothetical protein [Epidermidibacterium keratini]QHC00865.1 hypothetical protein EK0264_11605 [Epidermidibacterium keratini]